jgi:hypothetical protein
MENILPFMIPITALMIPIVAILTQHQRRMAEIMRQNTPQGVHEIAELRREVAQLKEIVNQQALQMDDFLTKQGQLMAPPPAPQNLHERLNS